MSAVREPLDGDAVELAQARRWIGRRLELRDAFNGHPAGTRCVVMCVADFGEGLLLWITTDDPRLDEVDQVSLAELHQRFRPQPPCRPRLVAREPGSSTRAGAPG